MTAGARKTQRLEIIGRYPRTELARWVFSQLGLMHLVAPDLPETIRTDFAVAPQTQELIAAMYGSEGVAGPIIHAPEAGALPFERPRGCSARRCLVEYSGGKDSMRQRALPKGGTAGPTS
jgi:hypothetical protein